MQVIAPVVQRLLDTLLSSHRGNPSLESPEQKPEHSTFRAEAVDPRRRRQGPGELIRLSPGWTDWAFYLIIGLFVAALIAASLIDIARYASGSTTTEDDRIVVLVPAAQASTISQGNRVELGSDTAYVVAFEGDVLYPPEVKERFRIDVSVPSVAVVTSAPARAKAAGTARVLVESRPVIVALVPGLGALFGQNDA